MLHKFIGPEYLASVVDPEIGSQAREVISQYTAQEVYTSREAIQEKIRDRCAEEPGHASQQSGATRGHGAAGPEALQRLPAKLDPDSRYASCSASNCRRRSSRPSIGRPQQFYEIQEFKYRVEREAQESKRKQIEANGIAAFQQTVSQGISDSYLRWRGIEATLALAQSPNSKIVIIGGGKDGLPIILGNVDSVGGSSSRASVSEDEAPTDKLSAASPGPAGNGLVKPVAPGGPLATVDRSNSAAISSTPPDVTQANTPTASEKDTMGPAARQSERSNSYLPRDFSNLKTLLPNLPDWLSGWRTAAPRQ